MLKELIPSDGSTNKSTSISVRGRSWTPSLLTRSATVAPTATNDPPSARNNSRTSLQAGSRVVAGTGRIIGRSRCDSGTPGQQTGGPGPATDTYARALIGTAV